MTTTDDFTEAARVEALRAWVKESDRMDSIGTLGAHMAEWARDRLTTQEPTDAEVLAALNADYALRYGGRNIPADSLEPYGDEAVQIMRAALSAARAVRDMTMGAKA